MLYNITVKTSAGRMGRDWRKKVRQKPVGFKSRVFFAYSAVIVLCVCAFSGVLAGVIASGGGRIERAAQEEGVLSALRQVEMSLRELDTLASQTMSNAQLISYFVPLCGDTDNENYFEHNLLEYIDATSLLATLNGVTGTAARVSVYNLGGDYVSAGALYETKEYITRTLSDKETLGAQLEAIERSPQRRVVLPPAADRFSNSATNRLFSILKPLSNAYVSQIYGIVAVQQDIGALEASNLFYQDENSVSLLMDGEGNILLPEDPGGMAEQARLGALSFEDDGQRVSSGEYEGREGRLFVSKARADIAGWYLVRAKNRAALSAPYRSTLMTLALAAALLAAALVLAVYLLADRVTRPLSRLSEAVERVTLNHMALDEREYALGRYAPAEVYALDRAFRETLGRLNESIGMEMRAYLHALQSQMNPHFLYNILSVICATGEEEGSEKTVSMCLKLSEMLRYIANYESDAVTLRDEVAHAERYMQLMKVRYEDKFNYCILADEAALNLKVPRLILQPLIENCFAHGFAQVRPPWSIRVTIQAQGDRFLMTVADNGSGMTEEQIKALCARIDRSAQDLAGNYPALRLGGMGLINSCLRLKLFFHGDVRYAIMKSGEGGTLVQIGGPMKA